MPTTKLSLLTAIVALTFPGAASAAFEHVVAPGESLSSVAAADGLSVAQVAAANGLSPESQLVAGTLLAIPPQTGPSDDSVTPTPVPESSGTSGTAGDQAPATSGGYVVAPGDTLSAIAARYGLSVDQLAAANGLDPNGILLAGSTIAVSGAAPSSSSTDTAPAAATETSAPAPEVGAGGAQPTPETVSPEEVGSIASENGVSPSLAEAIGYQESGFNNDLVSSTGATGVMQIEPGTWDYIGSDLATPPPLSPDSATDNIRGGVLLLHSLLAQTGGDAELAAAGYYQGLQSVLLHGMYSDTQQYVNDVMALQQRFGGP
ncbi:MAG: LysM peptidoglycan-binding domain-containing protein [Solirubrobacteraceae bacterium]